MLGKGRVREIFRRTGLDRELTHRPAGKRSVAVAKKGKAVHRRHGTRRSICLWNGKGVHKKDW